MIDMKKQKPLKPNQITDKVISTLSETLKLMGDPSRLRIILCCLEKPVCVGDIVDRTGFSQSLVSHHLRLLRAARLVKSERKGRQIFYAVDDEHISCVLIDMVDHVRE